MSNKTAFIFPGQGSQFVGMGKDLFDSFSEAREVFEEVDDVLKQKLSALMFSGSQDELTKTQNAQPALMAVSAAVIKVLQKQCNVSVNDLCVYLAGHSLGEYSALYAAGSLTLRNAALILKIRGEAMGKAAEESKGAMLALLGTDESTANLLVTTARKKGICQIANDNGAGQFVLSGEEVAIDFAASIAREHEIKRTVKLNVSGAFHSPLMHTAEQELKNGLHDMMLNQAKIPIIANFTADPVQEAEEIKQLLVKQISGTVKWRQSMEYMINAGITRFIEIGAGKVLSTIAKRMNSNLESLSIQSPEDLEQIVG